ncbi:hypothetical protein GGE68_004895 [Rhizobium leguminosarum]|uniref:hypothetical protein n=1 Tax=Rhizobium leguminosarum TaxID=384 RepID=UPI00160F16D0|nr:hypothetical protein [Rhizobium leguminosarum]MBB5666663.1 hypothetical protein [Rhizobium leguminosarum]
MNILKDWQTFITGLAAIIPASIAAVFVWKQINEQRAQFLQLTERQSHKARLRLSRNASRISQSLDEFYIRLLEGSFEFADHSLGEEIVEDVLDAGIMSGKANFEFVKSYVMCSQRYASLCGLYAESGRREHLVEIFRELATLDCMTDALYPFARFESEVIIMPEINRTLIERQLTVNLRRGKDISNTNLSQLLKDKAFI